MVRWRSRRDRRKFFEFFTANIENDNTRRAYARDIAQFMNWCDALGLGLETLDPVTVAAFVKHLQ